MACYRVCHSSVVVVSTQPQCQSAVALCTQCRASYIGWTKATLQPAGHMHTIKTTAHADKDDESWWPFVKLVRAIRQTTVRPSIVADLFLRLTDRLTDGRAQPSKAPLNIAGKLIPCRPADRRSSHGSINLKGVSLTQSPAILTKLTTFPIALLRSALLRTRARAAVDAAGGRRELAPGGPPTAAGPAFLQSFLLSVVVGPDDRCQMPAPAERASHSAFISTIN